MTNTIKLHCWCCGNPRGQHKLSCGSKSRVEGLQWLLNSLHSVPEETLDLVISSCQVELMERYLSLYNVLEEDNQ